MVAFGKDFDYPGKPIRVVISEEEGQDMLLALAHQKLMRILDQAADAGKTFGQIAKLLGLSREDFRRVIEAPSVAVMGSRKQRSGGNSTNGCSILKTNIALTDKPPQRW